MGSAKDSTQHKDTGKRPLEFKSLVPLHHKTEVPQIITTSKAIFTITNSRRQLLIFMVVLFLAVNYLDLFKHPTDSLISNIRMMILVINLVVVYLAVVFLPEPSKKRGFALFWKIVQGCAMAYSLNILVWLFFSKENLQYILKNVYDSNLGQPLGEKSYAEDCRVFTPENPKSYFANITGSFDIFVLAHFLGWTFKVWIFRNSAMAWVMSVGFEIMEWTMEVWLPNFKECWWDHFLFDLFGCNLIGMLIGQYTIRKFNMRKLFWFVERTEEYEALPWYKKFVYAFTSRDEHVKTGKWHWLSELWTFNAVIWFWFMNMYIDLSYFYNKAMIEIPPPHWLCAVRIWILAFFCIIAANDYYDYIVTRKCHNMTLPIFLLHFIMIVEGLLFLKNIKSSLFDNPLHYHIKVFWIGFFVIMAAVQLYLLGERVYKNRKLKSSQVNSQPAKPIKAH